MGEIITVHKSNWDELQTRAGDLETQNALLQVLVRGCKDHRSYRAIRKPRVVCGLCKFLWATAETLRTVKVDV